MAQLMILHGPNLNLLGTREPELYGRVTLDGITQRCEQLVQPSGHALFCWQSNAEHELIERIHWARQQCISFIVFNPAAFTHTSIALRDALLGVKIPFIEIHLSNIHARESFRQYSYFSDIAVGVISGLGAQGYELAVQGAIHYLANQGSGV